MNIDSSKTDITAESSNIMLIRNYILIFLERNQKVIDLFWDESKLSSYLENFLVPVLEGIQGETALFAIDIINEMEALVYNNREHENPCFDTTGLKGMGLNVKNLICFSFLFLIRNRS